MATIHLATFHLATIHQATFSRCSRSRERADIETEGVEGQGRPPRQSQLTAAQIEAGDLRLNEAHTGQAAESAQVDRTLRPLVEARHQPRHHAGIEGGAAAIDQGDQAAGRTTARIHGPKAQQQGMAVATASQQQQVLSRRIAQLSAVGALHAAVRAKVSPSSRPSVPPP